MWPAHELVNVAGAAGKRIERQHGAGRRQVGQLQNRLDTLIYCTRIQLSDGGIMERDVVVVLYENEGAPIPRHRLAFPKPAHEGLFQIGDEIDTELKRTMPIARLRSAEGAGDDVLPPLRDAKLLWQRRGVACYTGVEMECDLSRRRTGQSWKVFLAGYQGRGQDPD
ncbi:hypothetical protein GCM10027277_57560 [Pseudoduganella ginsengisoli]